MSKKGNKTPTNNGAIEGNLGKRTSLKTPKGVGAKTVPGSRSFSTAGPASRRSISSVRTGARSPSPSRMPKEAKKLIGTASVYSRQPQSPFDLAGSGASSMKSPQEPVRPRPSPAHNSPERKLLRNGMRNSRKQRAAAGKTRSIDSTWFFPVGARVRHMQLGEGVVLPPDAKTDEEHDVLVRFSSGEQRRFPLLGSDLSPFIL